MGTPSVQPLFHPFLRNTSISGSIVRKAFCHEHFCAEPSSCDQLNLPAFLLFPAPQNGMHTLCLLDIKVKEPDFEKMARGKTCFLPPRYMSVS